jgi:hypothetical protein
MPAGELWCEKLSFVFEKLGGCAIWLLHARVFWFFKRWPVVKVLKNGVGPDFWIAEPLTEQERRIEADRLARDARKYPTRVEECKALLQQWIDNDPVPPVTAAERAAFRKDYPPRHHLIDDPKVLAQEWRDNYAAIGRATRVNFYNGAPHRPNPSDQASRPDPVVAPAASHTDQ